MKQVVTFLFILLLTNVNGQNTITQIGASSRDMGFSVKCDYLGNIYTYGFIGINDTVDFNPTSGVNTLIGPTSFVLKQDSLSNFIWVREIRNVASTWLAGSEYPDYITTDNIGNIYITGFFGDTIDIDPGIGIHNITSNGSADIYVLKLDSGGNFIWANSFGGLNLDQGGYIDIDKFNNIYLSGIFEGTVDFDPGASVYNLSSNGNRDFFIQKISPNGDFIWAKSVGGIGRDDVYHFSVDKDGTSVIAGIVENTVDFDPGTGQFNLSPPSPGSGYHYILKLDSIGGFVWAKKYIDFDCMNTDNMGNTYFAGSFQFGQPDFDPGVGITNLNPVGRDMFVSKINSTGNLVWVKQISSKLGTSGFPAPYSIVIDDFGYVFFTGDLKGTYDFDPSIDSLWISSLGENSIFVASLRPDGRLNFVEKVESGPLLNRSNSISINQWNDIYLTGYFYDTAYFYADTLVSHGNEDIFIQKRVNECRRSYFNYSTTTCSSYILPSGNDTISIVGSYLINDTITNYCGSDSVLYIDLTINPIYSLTPNISICSGDSIFLEGAYQTTSGVYYDSLQTISGCDSVLYTTLTISPIYSSIKMDTICQGDSILLSGAFQTTSGTYIDSSLTIEGCDSVITTMLFVNSVFTSNQNKSICQNDSLLIYGSYQNTTGIYYDSLQTINGCDSILSTTLTVNSLPSVSISSFNPDTLCTNANAVILPTGSPSGGNYSGNGVIVSNFHPSTAGVGAHDIIYTYTDGNSCSNNDTTVIVIVLCTAINNINTDFGIIIYPNPSTGQFTIEKPNDLNKEVQVKLLDATSKLIFEKVIPIDNQKVKMDIRNYSKGIYYLQLIVDDKTFVKQILKN